MENLLKKVYGSKKLSFALTVASHAIVILSALALVPLFWSTAVDSWVRSVQIAAILIVPLVIVSLVRHLINAPRPYELYSFYELAPKSKKGGSFPSRHAFSVFAIGTALCFVHPVLGAVLLALGVLLCVMRVLLGIHFIRDVVAGALTGALSSVIGMLIIF